MEVGAWDLLRIEAILECRPHSGVDLWPQTSYAETWEGTETSWMFNQRAKVAKQLQGKIKGNERTQGKHDGEDLDKTRKPFKKNDTILLRKVE